MDTECADFADYARCLGDLARVNVVTRTHQPILRWLARETQGCSAMSLLDVGCGHGDLLRRIRRWGDRRGLKARLIGVDRNPWSIRAARAATPSDAGITYDTADVFDYVPEPVEFIVSSQFAHHLADDQVVAFIRWMELHAVRGWFIADLHRHWLPYFGFPLLARLARWHRFVRLDGQVSIARAFTAADWRTLIKAADLTPADVEVRWNVPFRYGVARRCARR